jgi:hypothetical protein
MGGDIVKNRWYLKWWAPLTYFALTVVGIFCSEALMAILGKNFLENSKVQLFFDVLFEVWIVGLGFSMFLWPLWIAWNMKSNRTMAIYLVGVAFIVLALVAGGLMVGQSAADDLLFQ